MKIELNFKAHRTIKPFKAEVTDIVKNLRFGSTSQGVSMGYYDNEYAYGFVYHKVRKQIKSQKRITKIHNGVEVKTTKYTYEPKKWIISYYKIPIEILKFANLELKQKPRHFELKPKSH